MDAKKKFQQKNINKEMLDSNEASMAKTCCKWLNHKDKLQMTNDKPDNIAMHQSQLLGKKSVQIKKSKRKEKCQQDRLQEKEVNV